MSFRQAITFIEELEGTPVCLVDGCYMVGEVRYFSVQEVIRRAVMILEEGGFVW